MYLTNTEGYFRGKSSGFSFIALTNEISDWLCNLGDAWNCIYRVEADLDIRIVNKFTIDQFNDAVATSNGISYYIGCDDLNNHFQIPERYSVINLQLDSIFLFNGFLSLKHKVVNDAVYASFISGVHTAENLEKGLVFENFDSIIGFRKFRRIANKNLGYHSFVLPPYDLRTGVRMSLRDYLKNPTLGYPATEAAIKAHQVGCDWLPGPKREVKPRVRKKKT